MKIDSAIIDSLHEKANLLRTESLRLICHGQVGHPGGCLSAAEIIACLYFYPVLRVDPQNPRWEDRDRFILSKHHTCQIHYIALAERGFFGREELERYGYSDSLLQPHSCMKVPGVDMSGGSLGQGLSVGVGIALGAKFLLRKSFRTYCLIGDGELNSGQIWEAAQAAAHYKLDNLTAILDYNKIEAKGPLHEQMGVEPVAGKWRNFGWETIEVDGHDVEEILLALHRATHINLFGKPTVIIAHTIKGKGVTWMELNPGWHSHPTNHEQTDKAVAEIEAHAKEGATLRWR